MKYSYMVRLSAVILCLFMHNVGCTISPSGSKKNKSKIPVKVSTFNFTDPKKKWEKLEI